MPAEKVLSPNTGQPMRGVDLLVSRSVREQSGIGRYVYELERSLTAGGTPVRRSEFRYLPFADRRPVLRVLPIGVESPPEGQIYHLPNSRSAAVLLIARSLRPAVVTVHDIGALYNPDDRVLGSRISRGLLRLSWRGMRRADRIIAVSEFTRQGLIKAGFDPRRIITIHEGVDQNRFRPIPDAAVAIRERYGVDMATRPTVLYVGNEFPRKNLATLVRALGRLKRDGPPIQWVKVGAAGYAPGRAELNQLIDSEGLTKDVTFVEHVPDEDLPRFYSAASVYVQPSTWEGFGLPVLEAMACGVPVVAAKADALIETCGDAALLVNLRDAEGMAGKIGNVLSDERLREGLRQRGFRRAAEFTWETAAARTQAVYGAL
jgi:glycosyltransferase involved in cell wall biosynthesis